MMATKNLHGCQPFLRQLAIERRSFLRAGFLAMAGLGMSDLLRLQAANGNAPRGKSVILLWMRGGPSQHETWDPKPEAPEEYRGIFGASSTSVPGIQLCDLLPQCGKIMDRWSIIRSLHHKDAGHSAGDQLLFTGYPNEGDPNTNTHPSIGSVVSEQLQRQRPSLPAYVMIPRSVPGTGAAYLGPACQAFETQADPAREGPFKLPNFRVPDSISVGRLEGRRQLLRSFDRMREVSEHSMGMSAVDSFQRQAWEMISSPQAQKAFDLDAEPRVVRNRYGFMPAYKAPTPDRCGVPAWSQRFLLPIGRSGSAARDRRLSMVGHSR